MGNSGAAGWGWEKLRWLGPPDGPGALPGPAGAWTAQGLAPSATFHPHAALRGSAPRSSLARSPRAVSLTHGLGHLHLLVEPLAQNLGHGSACAFYRKPVWERAGKPAEGLASSCCHRQPVAKEAYPGLSLGREGRQCPGAEDGEPWPAPCRRVSPAGTQAPGLRGGGGGEHLEEGPRKAGVLLEGRFFFFPFVF